MAVRTLESGSKVAAVPGWCVTVAGTAAGITQCSQELGAVAAAGQSTRTGTAAFASVLSATLDRGLSARFTAELNSRLNAQVKPELAAQLAAQLAARLIAGLSVALTS
jgi:hypothetical protein